MAVQYITSGDYHRNSGDLALSLPYPAGIQPGDAIFLQVGHNNNSTQINATYSFPGGYSEVASHTQQLTRQFIYKMLATGSESGSVSVTASGGTSAAIHQGVLRVFRGQDESITIESLAFSGNSTSDPVIEAAAITTLGADRLGLQFVVISADQAPSNFTGEIGTDYAIVSQSGVGTARMSLQVGAIASAGAVTGGSFTLGANSAAITTGFALVPSLAVPPLPLRIGAKRVVRFRRGTW